AAERKAEECVRGEVCTGLYPGPRCAGGEQVEARVERGAGEWAQVGVLQIVAGEAGEDGGVRGVAGGEALVAFAVGTRASDGLLERGGREPGRCDGPEPDCEPLRFVANPCARVVGAGRQQDRAEVGDGGCGAQM